MNFKRKLKSKTALEAILFFTFALSINVLAIPPTIDPSFEPADTKRTTTRFIRSSFLYERKEPALKKIQEACGLKFKNGYTYKASQLTHKQKAELEQIVDDALKNGAINSPYFYGNTLLHYAAIFDCPYLIDLLKKAGADMDIKNHSENTPLHMALSYKNYDAALSLLSYNVRLDIPNNHKDIPLMIALQKGLPFDIIRRLIPPTYSIENDKKFMNSQGKTPLWWLQLHHNRRLYMQVLREHSEKSSPSSATEAELDRPCEESPLFFTKSFYETKFGGSAMVFAPDPDDYEYDEEDYPEYYQYAEQEESDGYNNCAPTPADHHDGEDKNHKEDHGCDSEYAQFSFHAGETYVPEFTQAETETRGTVSIEAPANPENAVVISSTPFIHPTPCDTPLELAKKRARDDESNDTPDTTEYIFSRTLSDIEESQDLVIKELQYACGITFKDGKAISQGGNEKVLAPEQISKLNRIVSAAQKYNLLDEPYIGGQTLLFYAAMFNCPYLIQKLHDEGANLTYKNPTTGYTALQIAEMHNSMEAFESLKTLTSDANLKHSTSDDMS